jgi:hypothetical protein
MAKKSTNSGFERQAAVMGQFTRDAKVGGNTTTVDQAIKQGQKNAEYRAKVEKPVRVSFRFLSTGK